MFCWRLKGHCRKGQDPDQDPLVRVAGPDPDPEPKCPESGTLILFHLDLSALGFFRPDS